jgi:hypothetical protein
LIAADLGLDVPAPRLAKPPRCASAPPEPLAPDTLVAMAAELGADLSGWRPPDYQSAN